MTQKLYYDWSTCVVPGQVEIALLRAQLQAALSPITCSVNTDATRTPGTEIEVIYSQTLSAGEVTTASGVVTAHDGTKQGPTAAEPVPVTTVLSPNPPSRTWADIPDASITLDEGTAISGSALATCWVGTSSQPCGGTLNFAASLKGGSLSVAQWGFTGGNVSQFGLRLEGDGVDTITVQVRRNGTRSIAARCELRWELELTQ